MGKKPLKQLKPRDTLTYSEKPIFDREIKSFKNTLTKKLDKDIKKKLIEEEEEVLLSARIKNGYYGTKENNGVK